jgi:cephalosporin hydroxylase
MKLIIDTDAGTVTEDHEGVQEAVGLYTPRAFELVSQQWLKIGWQQKYSYRFTWLGRPIIQLPEDVLRVQEVIFRVRPDVIVETGVAHGGSLILYASLCKLLGRGRVIGIDIEIRPSNRRAIESHPLANFITLIEGSSTAPEVCGQVASAIVPQDTVLVLLDSNHSRAHVLTELEAYHRFVTPGSYVVATDGIMRDLADVPSGRPEWVRDNPATAAVEFAAAHPEFALEDPAWPFNESPLQQPITYWPSAWLRRLR